MRAGHVEKIANSTSSDARPRLAQNALRVCCVCLVYVRCASLYVAKNRCTFGMKNLLNMLKNFLEACPGRVTFTFRISSMRIIGALNML